MKERRILVLCVLGAGCVTAAVSQAARVPPMPPASSFSARVDNVWFPLRPGSRYVYTGVKDAKRSRDVVVVTHRTRRIIGVPCVAVSDRLYLRGRLEERTTDWYSQDAKGNVWYFGENTAELDARGRVTSTEGSWTAGVERRAARHLHDGPSAAWAVVGAGVLQGPRAGPVQGDRRVRENAVLTQETTPLEPGTVDHKLYVRGIGTVLEQTEKGPNERNELVSFTRR